MLSFAHTEKQLFLFITNVPQISFISHLFFSLSLCLISFCLEQEATNGLACRVICYMARRYKSRISWTNATTYSLPTTEVCIWQMESDLCFYIDFHMNDSWHPDTVVNFSRFIWPLIMSFTCCNQKQPLSWRLCNLISDQKLSINRGLANWEHNAKTPNDT